VKERKNEREGEKREDKEDRVRVEYE